MPVSDSLWEISPSVTMLWRTGLALVGYQHAEGENISFACRPSALSQTGIPCTSLKASIVELELISMYATRLDFHRVHFVPPPRRTEAYKHSFALEAMDHLSSLQESYRLASPQLTPSLSSIHYA